MCMFMATKTITVTDESYQMLKSIKQQGESFSELIKRAFSPKRDIMKFAGIISEEDAEGIKASIRELREFSVKRFRERG